MHTREEKMKAFGRLLDVLDELRENCPWDRKQTNESLRPNTIEETYELCDALMKDDQRHGTCLASLPPPSLRLREPSQARGLSRRYGRL